LLETADKGGPQEAAQMADLLSTLGKSADDLAHDLNVIANARTYRSGIEHYPRLEAEREKLQAALQEHIALVEKTTAELKREQARLSDAAASASATAASAGQCQHKLNQLMRKIPTFSAPCWSEDRQQTRPFYGREIDQCQQH
jgi:septal ring factor EnvC (AmiA/AmiB activator)